MQQVDTSNVSASIFQVMMVTDFARWPGERGRAASADRREADREPDLWVLLLAIEKIWFAAQIWETHFGFFLHVFAQTKLEFDGGEEPFYSRCLKRWFSRGLLMDFVSGWNFWWSRTNFSQSILRFSLRSRRAKFVRIIGLNGVNFFSNQIFGIPELFNPDEKVISCSNFASSYFRSTLRQNRI